MTTRIHLVPTYVQEEKYGQVPDAKSVPRGHTQRHQGLVVVLGAVGGLTRGGVRLVAVRALLGNSRMRVLVIVLVAVRGGTQGRVLIVVLFAFLGNT